MDLPILQPVRDYPQRQQQDQDDQRGEQESSQCAACREQSPNQRFFCDCHQPNTPASQNMITLSSTQAT